MKRFVFLIVLVGLGLGAWYWLQAAGYLGDSEFSSDPQVAELQRMSQSFREQNAKDPKTMPSEDHRKLMGEKIRELSDEQRREFFESGRDAMREMMENRMKKFFTLSPEEQKKQLDEDIDRMEKMRKEGRGGPWGGGDRGRRGGDEERNSSNGNGGDNQAKSNEDGQQKESRPPRDTSVEGRQDRRRQMLSHTTPEQRAMFSEYRTRLDARMKERGIQPPTFRRGG